MLRVSDIKSPIATEIAEFERRFKGAMKSKTPLLDKITHYIVKRKGKQMRPMFVFLSAKTCGTVSDGTYTAASLIELLHTATLVHDDVVDDASQRRGFFSLNALWKNKIAVLVGDYLLAKGLLLSIDNDETDLLKIVSGAVRDMSEGELLQIEKSRMLNITEDVYFDVIRQKTASLIAACCASGAASAGADQETIDRMWKFGELTGIAFQIKDDLFDYGEGKDIGKPTGADIKERKMTLPLIHSLSEAPRKERKRIVRLVKNRNEDPKAREEVIDYVQSSGGIDYAREKMMEYRKEALEVLAGFPENASRESLSNLVDYTINRKK